ncbi:hypothetical protein FGB62_118g03 [Gracilaria domingensis]|nr:hypothetical protein FGB62_118g03 [Gracilaria domingensis]
MRIMLPAVLVSLVLVHNMVPALAAGGILARCFKDKDCAKGLKCRGTSNVFSDVVCNEKDSYCACAPLQLSEMLCTVQSSCNRFETCTAVPPSLVEQLLPQALSLNLKICLDKSQTRFVQSPKTCARNSQCSGMGAQCVGLLELSLCVSSSVPRRGSNKDQDSSLEVSPTPSPEFTEPSFTVQNDTIPQVTPFPNQSSDPGSAAEENLGTNTCIASKLLDHMSPELLLYKNSLKAHVLCDVDGSCATPGHILVYQGRSMMMSSYCSHVECKRRVMYVNSPRYKRKLRIPSKTKHLEFTAFSARYGTKLEERLMQTAEADPKQVERRSGDEEEVEDAAREEAETQDPLTTVFMSKLPDPRGSCYGVKRARKPRKLGGSAGDEADWLHTFDETHQLAVIREAGYSSFGNRQQGGGSKRHAFDTRWTRVDTRCDTSFVDDHPTATRW